MQQGVNINIKNKKGNTALHLARKFSFISDELIIHGAALEIKNHLRKTSLEAIINKDFEHRVLPNLIQYIKNAPISEESLAKYKKKLEELQPRKRNKDPEVQQIVQDIFTKFYTKYEHF